MSTTAVSVDDQLDGVAASSKQLELYGGAASLLLGIPANCVLLVVLRGAYFRKTCSSLLLLSITLCDMAVLLTFALRWFVDALTDLDIANLNTGSCMVFQHVTHTLRGLSAWVLLLVTFERALAIHRIPLGLKTIGKQHLRLSVLTICFALLAANSHWYWNINQMSHLDGLMFNCPFFDFSDLHLAWWWFDVTLNDLLPLFLLLIAACSLTAKLSLAIIHRTTVLHSSSSHNFSNFESHVTALSLALSYFYFLTELPFVIAYMSRHRWRLSKHNQVMVDSACMLLGLIFCSCKLPLYVCIVNKSLWRIALQKEPADRKRRTANIDDSDLMTSKGLSQGSVKCKGKKLEDMLNQLEHKENPQGSEYQQKDEAKNVHPTPEAKMVPEKPRVGHRKRLSTSRRKKSPKMESKHEEGDADSDLGSSLSSGTHQPHQVQETPESEELAVPSGGRK